MESFKGGMVESLIAAVVSGSRASKSMKYAALQGAVLSFEG